MAVDTASLLEAVRQLGRERTQALADRFVEVAQGIAPRRTGAGADSITVESIDETGSGYVARIVVGETYMLFQNEGTGIYGPDGEPITARRGGVLAFDWPAAGGMVFAHSVRGTEPTHWWDRTIAAWGMIVETAR